jgi:hypothetical protein
MTYPPGAPASRATKCSDLHFLDVGKAFRREWAWSSDLHIAITFVSAYRNTNMAIELKCSCGCYLGIIKERLQLH